ncbi:MAG: Spy/CpxP family protein refolding chaperone [Caldimonas manganoxidans]|nr:Spy/CpxP family protein refolding chaperone [Caldimonas manganoxidans]
MDMTNLTWNWFKRGVSVGAAAVALTAAGAAVAAASNPGPGSPPALHMAMHHGGPSGGLGFRLGDDPQHVDRMVDRVARDLALSQAQADQIRAIARAAAQDLQGQRDKMRALKEQAARVWTQPQVDAAAVESMRQQHMALMDERSRRINRALLEISAVLTPEQRTQLVQRMQERRHERRQERHEGVHRRNAPPPTQ